MKLSIRKGVSFGLTSGIITTLGLIVGLHSGTGSKKVILAGIFTIAIADALSDALGIHVSEESEEKHSTKEIWESTVSTFLAKLFFTLTFVIPFLLLDLSPAIIASIVWGLLMLSIISYSIARAQKKNPLFIIGEHIIIAVVVVLATHFVGEFIASIFV